MRIAVGALLLSTALVGVAAAEPYWKGPAWYVVADTIVGPFVWQGPYDSKEACEASKPANEEDADYVCEYLAERPSWDD
jgi:hypothetical protein